MFAPCFFTMEQLAETDLQDVETLGEVDWERSVVLVKPEHVLNVAMAMDRACPRLEAR